MAESDSVYRSKSAPARIPSDHPVFSLGNQDSNMTTNRQTSQALSLPIKSVNKIQTYVIWSGFNLLFLPFGILCCYFSYRVNQFKMQNRYEMAKKWSQRTFVLNIITTLIMIGFIITVVMLHYDHEQRQQVLQRNQTQTTMAYILWQPGR